jgi:hypothetical protein
MIPLVAGLVAATCGTSREAGLSPEQKVPFIVCESSDSWTRPSEEEQAKEIWARARYAGVDTGKLRAVFYENFFPRQGGNSELFDSWPLHGLWSADDTSTGDLLCNDYLRVIRQEDISVYLLLHEAREVSLSGNTYQIVVEETPSGFQEIRFRDLLFPEHATQEPLITKSRMTSYTVVIVNTQGEELARSEGGGLFQEPSSESP